MTGKSELESFATRGRRQPSEVSCLVSGQEHGFATLLAGRSALKKAGFLIILLSSACLFGGEDRSSNGVGSKEAVGVGAAKREGLERDLSPVLDNKHKLAIGDRLSFRIEEDQEDPKPLIVTDSGDLELPYIGRFPAENKTCKQLAQEIKAALEKEYYYQATVIIAVDSMTKSRGKIYLVGPVRTPGAQDIPSDEVLTLSKAILRAGGFNDFADKHNVRVTRKGKESEKKSFVVDVGEILEKGRVERDLTLEPGDLILVLACSSVRMNSLRFLFVSGNARSRSAPMDVSSV